MKGRAALLILLVAAFGIRLAICLIPVPVLIGKFLSDDAYYYFRIAKNIALGHGASFDGISPTNGFHPLYAVALVPLFYIFGADPDSPVRAALIMLSAFDVCAGYCIYRMVKIIGDERGALIGSSFWLLNPCIFFVAFTGTEAALCAFAVAFALLLWAQAGRDGDMGPARMARLGALTGLAMLARSDSIILLLAFCIAILAGRGSSAKEKTRAFAALCAAAVAVCAPWLVWNLALFGTIRQVSGEVKPYIQDLLFTREGTGYFSNIFSNLRTTYIMIATSSGVRAPGLSLIVVAVASAFVFRRKGGIVAHLRAPGAAAAYVILLFLFYSLYFWHIQAWYFHALLMAVCVLLGWASSVWLSCLGRPAAMAWEVVVAALIALAAANGCRYWRLGFYPWQRAYHEVALELGRRFGTGERFAAFNAGIYGYYAEPVVVNMDGVVNNSALAAMRDGTLFGGFIERNRIRYLVDHEHIVRMYWGFFGKGRMEDLLEPVVAVDIPWRFSEGSDARIVVYEVKRPAP